MHVLTKITHTSYMYNITNNMTRWISPNKNVKNMVKTNILTNL